ncbi:MAG: CapA family protein, partial [Anaerolineae bacterium]
MGRKQQRLALSGLIVVELFAAALALRWALAVPGRAEGAAVVESTASPVRVGAAADLPAELRAAIHAWAAGQPARWTWSESGRADLAAGWSKERGARPLAEVVLVPVVAFPSPREEVGEDELRRAWRGRSRPEDGGLQLLVLPGVVPALDAVLGQRGAGAAVTLLSAEELAQRLWAEPEAVGIVPFEGLEPRLKALPVDGVTALDRSPSLARYPLAARVWANGDREAARALAAALAERGLDSNRHSEQMTALLMTGVTALTRGVALQIEAHGDPAWPARQIAGLLAAADLTHVSNEVSFMDGCLPAAEMRSFCARPAYLQTLRLAGVDVVELTGNHNLDFGPQYALRSLDLYADAGMATFGGGRDEAQARQPLLVEHNGNRLAFLGYNQFGPDYAWADDGEPGAARFSLEAVQADLAALASRADVVFVNVQHTETYGADPLPEQVADFRAVADAVAATGAGVVTGSQAHQPQAIEFRDGTPIFYGLGNLFFDQTWSDATRQGLVVRHWIYRGRLIACQLIPTIIDDNDQTRLATEQERAEILRAVF